MKKNKIPLNNTESKISINLGKTNPINHINIDDSVKNVRFQQNSKVKINSAPQNHIPKGTKRPKNTPK